MRNYLLALGVLLFISQSVYSQQKELDKLRSLVSKGKLEKAQIYCDKAISDLSEKKSEKFHAIMAKAYYNKKMYDEAAEQVLKSYDKKLAEKLANIFVKNNEITAAKLYVKAKKFDKGAELYFNNEKYKEAAEYSNSQTKNMEYGNTLFDKGMIEQSLLFYKKAKIKGKKFDNQKVLNYLYKQKDYQTIYQIQNYKEGDFKMEIQGIVFDKMVENAENVDFMKKFMGDIHIYNNKQDEVIATSYINNKMFKKLENYCMNLPKVRQKVTYAFIATNEQDRNPEISAWANSKLNKTLQCNELLSTFLIRTAKTYKHDTKDAKLLQKFIDNTKSQVEKCDKNYAEIIKYSKNLSFNKSQELKQSNKDLSEEYLNISNFLKSVEAKVKR